MRKKILIIISLTLIFFNNSCKTNNSDKNLLLAEEIKTSCVADLDNKDNPEWIKGFNRYKFFKEVFDIAMSGKVKVYGESALEDTINKILYTGSDVERRMKTYVDTFNLNLIKEIRFLEKWDLDNETLKFTKKVTAWTPIKVWKEKGETRKQMVFFVYPENEEKGKLMAENLLYEHPWEQEYPNLYTGFDQLMFLQRIIDGVKSGDLKAYDPIYLIDKSKREFNAKQLEEYIGIKLTAMELDWNIYSILFEEDWYFNEKTLQITKDVKSFAFVKSDYNPETEKLEKKIMFFIIPK